MEEEFYRLDILKFRLLILKMRLSAMNSLITKMKISVLKSGTLSLVTAIISAGYIFSNSSINDVTIESMICDKLIFSATSTILATGIYQSVIKKQELKNMKETYKNIQKEIEYVQSIMPKSVEVVQNKALKK